jgi:hypothetical protein
MRRPVSCRTAAEICRDLDLQDPARRLLSPDLTPRQFFERLVEQQEYADAVRFLAHALPKRLAVWWGCLCVWHVYRLEPPESVAAALDAALAWVLDPSEEHRRAAEAPAMVAELKSPAGCLAMAACWSGGSMAPPDLPVVPTPPDLTARLVGGAVLLAAAQRAPRLDAFYQQFLALGRDVARGKNRPAASRGRTGSRARRDRRVSEVTR